jgi:hypothetical protein
MTAAPKSSIREEVLAYLNACANILADKPGSQDDFVVATQILQQKRIRYTDEELRLVQRMLLRLSNKRRK